MSLRSWLETRKSTSNRSTDTVSSPQQRDHQIVELQIDGVEFSCAVDSEASDVYTEWIRGGASAEPPVTWAREIASRDWEVLDLGANVGIFSFAVGHAVDHVTAVEALPRNAELLALGVDANTGISVTAVHAAVWDEPGSVWLGGHSAWGQIGEKGVGVEVEAKTVSDLVRNHCRRNPNLVKIDIEGAEHAVLPGVLALAESENEFAIIYETNQYATPDPITELDEMVRSAGFTLWRLGPDPEMPTLVDPSIPQTSVYCDVLALKGIHHPRLPTEPPTTSQLIAELEQELQSPHPPHRAYAALAVKNFPNAVSSDPRLVTAANEVENSEDPETQDAISRLRPILDAGTGASGSSSV